MAHFIENKEILKEIIVELDRFKNKLALAYQEQTADNNYSNKHFASCKRAALDYKINATRNRHTRI